METKAPGYKTTEFWVTVALNVLNLFILAEAFPSDHWAVKVAGLLAAALSSGVYAQSRARVKAEAKK